MGKISPWIPMSDPHELAAILKLGEEAAKLAKACARAAMQGLNGSCPEQEGRTNAQEIAREYADVLAAQSMCENLKFVPPVDGVRILDKYQGFERWHDVIDENKAK